MTDNRSIKVGHDAVGNVMTTGDHNRGDAKVDVKLIKTTLPPADSVDLSKELAEIRTILERIGGEHHSKISRALDDAHEEAEKAQPNRDEIGTALNRALDYGKKTIGFAEEVGKLAPHITRAVAWLGSNWHSLLSLVGLTT